MDKSFWQQSAFLWGVSLIIIFPLLILVLGEVILAIQKRFKYLVGVVEIIRNFIIPSLAIYILLNKILGISPDTTPVQIIQTIAGVCTIHALLTLMNGLLFGSARVGTWQANTPKLFRDLIRFFLILVGTAIVLSVVWNADLGGLITALGVSSIVIGLALQDTLGNLFSGIALLFERPFGIGDWLEFDDNIGKVVEINWRSVHLLTRNLELLIIPNAILAKEILRNYRRPQKTHIEPINIGFSYDDPPNKVKRVLKDVALKTKGVQEKPEPIVQTINYNDSSIDYCVKLFVSDYNRVPQIRDEFITRIWYAANRNNLNIPFPIRTVYHEPPVKFKQDEKITEFIEYLKTFPSFVYLDNQDLEKLAQNATLKHFGIGEIAIDHETIQRHLYLIIEGQALISVLNKQGRNSTIASLTKSEFFGEMALISTKVGSISVTAVADLEVLMIKVETIQDILDRVPRLAREIGEVIENRRRAIRLANKDLNNTNHKG